MEYDLFLNPPHAAITIPPITIPTENAISIAVSSQTALEMAEGARKNANTDIGLSVTGIAGPDGGTKDKPVGLVYVGFCDEKGSFIKELHLTGNRERVRNLSAMHALNLLRLRLKEG